MGRVIDARVSFLSLSSRPLRSRLTITVSVSTVDTHTLVRPNTTSGTRFILLNLDDARH